MTDEAIETVQLQRTGQPPIQFRGRLVASAAEPLPEFKKAKSDSRRWHELKLYRTASGKFVLSIGFRTGMELEVPRDTVFVCEDLEQVERVLTEEGEDTYDPLEYLSGFPDRPEFETRQRLLENRVADDFDRRVGEILGKAGKVEEIE